MNSVEPAHRSMNGSASNVEAPNGEAAVQLRGQHALRVSAQDQPAMTVLVYSDDVSTRERIRLAVGRRPAVDLPRVEYLECATHRAVVQAADRGGIDVLVLDGEAVPTGGMGICRQLKDEIYNCPPVLILTGRRDDAWLAAWSRADAAVPHPINGVSLAPAVADLMRRRLAHEPVR
jgi:DNA-binding response OmpR family regulator